MKSLFEQPWLYAVIAFVLGLVIGYVARGQRKPATQPSEVDTTEAAAPPSGLLSPAASQAAVQGDADPQSPADKAPADSADEPAVDEVPAAESPVDEAPADEVPVDESPVDESPVDEASADKAPADKAPVNEASAEQPSADEAPVGEVPAAEVPADETPTGRIPVAEPVSAEEPSQAAEPAKQESAVAVLEAWTPGPYPNSALPTDGGGAPAEEFTIKAKADSKLFHTETSPYYRRVKPDVWFRTEAEATAAGFTGWVRRSKKTAAQ